MKRKKQNWSLVPWTPFLPCTVPTGESDCIAAFVNSRYQVFVYKVDGGPVFGDIAWLSIKTHDRQARHDWRDMQRIKNEIVGREFDAVEIYPAESKMVDAANQYHLWVFINGYKLPFGFTERMVSEGTIPGSRQRPWNGDERPEDALTQEEVNKKVAEYRAKREPI